MNDRLWLKLLVHVFSRIIVINKLLFYLIKRANSKYLNAGYVKKIKKITFFKFLKNI